jgi:hypothetical protein
LIELVQHTAPLRPGHAGIDPGERALTVSHHHAAAAPAGLRVTPARSALRKRLEHNNEPEEQT